MKKTNKLYLLAVFLLAGNVTADQTQREVALLKQRILLLESALRPASADAVANLFAEAVKIRNGAVQYMLFCPGLQSKYLSSYEEMNWVTGTSSPSVLSYKINKQSKLKYAIDYSMGLQGKKSGSKLDNLEIHEEGSDANDARFCISGYSRSENS